MEAHPLGGNLTGCYSPVSFPSASGQKTLMALGIVLACPTLGACGGYLYNGDKGTPWGAFIGLVVAAVAAVVIPTFYSCVIRG
jgi:hypothetical protein